MIINPDREVRKNVMKGLTKNGGYCPCMIEASEDTKCPCKWQREISLCVCGLFINEKEIK